MVGATISVGCNIAITPFWCETGSSMSWPWLANQNRAHQHHCVHACSGRHDEFQARAPVSRLPEKSVLCYTIGSHVINRREYNDLWPLHGRSSQWIYAIKDIAAQTKTITSHTRRVRTWTDAGLYRSCWMEARALKESKYQRSRLEVFFMRIPRQSHHLSMRNQSHCPQPEIPRHRPQTGTPSRPRR